MNRIVLYFLLFISFLPIPLPAQTGSRPTDLGTLANEYPERISKLFTALDIDRPELRTVKARVVDGDYPGACLALIEYYRNADAFPELRHPMVERADLMEADRLLTDTFTFQQLTGRQPRRPDGGLDWVHGGPSSDAEWAYLLNRHGWLSTLLDAYHYTGDERYARHLNDLLIDWIISNPFPVEEDCCPQWRMLEAGLRFRTWPAVFYGLQASKSFTDEARILMLISVMEHGALLQRFHWTHQNHALYQLNGLARLATFWPEFLASAQWFDYAARHMLYEMEGQVLPDGVQDELTTLYHHQALLQFQEVMDLARQAGKELSPAFQDGLEKMYHYLAFIQRPDGFSLLNNDSDHNDYRSDIAKAAKVFNRPDWEFIISNGRQGEQPSALNACFPYAGQVILRDGWGALSQWSFFDAGPDGTAHRHYDKLHLSVAAGGRDLLVDSGRYWYKSDVWREYFVSSCGHNIILVDGFGHRPDAIRNEKDDEVHFETSDHYSYAQATFEAGFRQLEDKVIHLRGLLHLPGLFWIVIDRLEADRQHSFQPLWHFHPDCKVAIAGNTVFSNNAAMTNLLIQPVGSGLSKPTLFFGPDSLNQPELYRDWKPRPLGEFPIFSSYSEQYNQKEAGSVAVYHGRLDLENTVAWLLIPFENNIPPRKVKARLRTKGGVVWLNARIGKLRLLAVVDLKEGKVKNLSLDGQLPWLED